MNDMNYGDDNFNFDPTAYQSAGAAILPQPGVYRMKATVARRKDKNTNEVVLTDGKYPTLVLQRISIVEPQEDEGSFSVFENVGSKPFKRKASGNRMVNVSRTVDLLRSIDVTKMSEVESFEHAPDLVEQELTAGEVFTARLGYKALDIEAAKAELQNIADDDYEAKNKVWNKYTYRTKAFRNGNGYNTAVTTPDGRVLQAKLVIDAFVDSNDSQKLGPFYRS